MLSGFPSLLAQSAANCPPQTNGSHTMRFHTYKKRNVRFSR